MTIKIPIAADFDGSKVEAQLQAFRQQLNALGTQIAAANKVKFDPVGKTSLDDMRKMVAQFEALKRVSGDMNKRINATGQKGANFTDLDWAKLYPDQNSRHRHMQKAFQYVTGSAFGTNAAPAPPGIRPPNAPAAPQGSNGGGGGGHGPGVVGGIAQAGLRAAGPAGGVAANAMGTGMSAGFGAGMMGLLGGIGALAIGKVVSSVTEKMGQAEDNLVAFDKLKRVLGDVNVGFVGLKSMLEGSAGKVGVTFGEAGQLASEFAKSGNLQGNQYGTLAGELSTGVGMSRSLGLDPSQGVGFLGSMRGMKATQDEQGSRKMALLVGETIAKSGAFAKADEVMGAISGYVTNQTRASLGANASGFASMFSSMVGSGIPGMDPTGAAGILSKINSSLSAGGAKGEASQFATAMVGQRLGLDPIQTRALREGGAFATNDSTFGEGSVAARYGFKGPAGNKTFLQATMEFVKERYGGNKGLQAEATANHLGIGMRQAMAVLSIDPSKMGELEGQLSKSGVNLKDMNFAGLGSLAKVVSGSSSDRMGVANELWSRTGKDKLDAAESSKLDTVMKTGSEQEQKDVLSQMIASRDQEMTQGKDIRDTKVGVDNIKTLMAEQLLPVTQAMRDGIMYMAGGGKKSGRQIQLDLMGVEHRENNNGIIRNSDYGKLTDRREELQARTNASEDAIRMTYRDKPEIMEAKLKERTDNLAEMAEIDKKLVAAKAHQTDLLEKENKAYEERKAGLDKQTESFTPGNRATPEGWRAPGDGASTATSGTGTAGSLLDAVIGQESGGQHLGANGGLLRSSAGARGIAQVMLGTGRDPGYGVSPLQNDSEEEYRRFGGDYLGAMLQLYGGDKQKALAAYNAGPGRVNKSIQKHGTDWLQHMPKETQNYVPNVLDRESRGTPIPANGNAAERANARDPLATSQVSGEMQLSLNLSAEARKLLQGPTSPLTTRLGPARPFGWA